MRTCVAACFAALLALTSCAAGGEELTSSGKGYPRPTIEFPAVTAPGSEQKAVLTIENPGPGDIPVLLVTFVMAAPASPGQGFPVPIVNGGPGGKDPNVVSIDPEPDAVDARGVNYRFGALPEGETTSITFTLRVPKEAGPAGNAITVSDGSEVERARGVRLQTNVEG
ncbi:MAG: hypothetical protein QOH90_1398 [Actinomycetota bacterium]|nr:hypothetical protein [Actinomycetota bacterium]